jgi:hypothetical protein
MKKIMMRRKENKGKKGEQRKSYDRVTWWDECFHELLQQILTYVGYASFWKFFHVTR